MIKFTTILLLSAFLQEGNWYTNKNGIAIDGYDLVGYFEGSATKGNKKFASSYEGTEFWFSSNAHLKSFEENPEKYLPQYGGYCAFAIADYAEKVKIDPKTYKVTNGKLYLFYNFNFQNTLVPWEKNEKELIKKADYNWKSKFAKK